jgi:hypothetical protein
VYAATMGDDDERWGNENRRVNEEYDQYSRANFDFVLEALTFMRRIVRSEREYDRLGDIIHLLHDRYLQKFSSSPRFLDRLGGARGDSWREDIDVSEAREIVRRFMPPFDGDRDL